MSLPQHIEIRTNLHGIDESMLGGFFEGWSDPPSPSTLLEILRRASYIAIAVDLQADCVVGFVNCIGDGILSAYIPLLEVRPNYRVMGVGSSLVRALLGSMPAYYMIDVCCDSALADFYTTLGFRPTRGMILRQYQSQSGLPSENR